MTNYFNTLNFRHKIQQLGVCEFLNEDKYSESDIKVLKGKKVVIVGCGAQGLNQGLNMRDSGLDVSFVLRQEAIEQKRVSYQNATKHGFEVGSYEAFIPKADLVCNLTPDKQHTPVVKAILPHMKKGATLAYSHGFNIVEEGMQIRKDITVIMVAPKSPGSEVREEYKRGFGVPTLIAVHEENDPQGKGYDIALAYAIATGGHRAGILLSSFVAEVKSDLMGEQTILCGLLQTGSILCFDKMVKSGIEPAWAAKFVQFGWETITEALKVGGLTHMMNRLSNPAKIKALEISEHLKELMTPLFYKHMDDIISGDFSKNMMVDWANNDTQLLNWREKTSKTDFEKTAISNTEITQQEFFDKGLLMVAIVKSGVELAFETMTKSGIQKESAYYESLHEVPLIANTIARKKLYEMNRTISDTAEYGCYLFDNECNPLIFKYIHSLTNEVIGNHYGTFISEIDDQKLVTVNESIASHPIESIGHWLRNKMRKKVI